MATITRAQVEKILTGRCYRKMLYAKILADSPTDSAPPISYNAALDDPIAEGLRSLGFYPTDPTAVVDLDLVSVVDSEQPQLLDIAELRLLENILGNRAAPNQMAGEEARQDHGDFYTDLETTVARKALQAKEKYGYGIRPLSAGSYDLGFTTRMPYSDWGHY